MSTALLNVNILISRVDRRPRLVLGHLLSHPERGATDPGNPRYTDNPGPPRATSVLAGSVSLLEQPGINRTRLLQAATLTDNYLLALAVHHGGELVTLDR